MKCHKPPGPVFPRSGESCKCVSCFWSTTYVPKASLARLNRWPVVHSQRRLSMRAATVSALCVFAFLLICSPRPAMGQSNSSSPLLIPQNPPASTKSFELPRVGETDIAPVQTHSANQFANPSQSWNLLAEQFRLNLDHLWSFKKGILPPPEVPKCTHIVIFQALDMDSEMIVEAPPGLGGNITTYKALQPCCGDLVETPHHFPGIQMLPRHVQPLVPPLSRPYLPPIKIYRPSSNLGGWLDHPR